MVGQGGSKRVEKNENLKQQKNRLKKCSTRGDDIAASTQALCFLVSKWLSISERPPYLTHKTDNSNSTQ